jgi:hypothetical protein
MVVWYMPVMKADRLGEQTVAVVKKLVYRTPAAASRSRFGVQTSRVP